MRFRVVVLAVAALVGVPAASATEKTYVGPAQVEGSETYDEVRADVHAFCVRKWPVLAGTTPGPLVIDDERTTATLAVSSGEIAGTCSFEPTGSGTATYDPRQDRLADRKVSSMWFGRGSWTDASGKRTPGVRTVRVAPGVAAVDLRLRDGRTVTAVVEAGMAVAVLPDDDAVLEQVVVKDASGVVLYDGPI